MICVAPKSWKNQRQVESVDWTAFNIVHFVNRFIHRIYHVGCC